MKYFSFSEFDSPDLKGSGMMMNADFLLMLDKSREIAGVPFRITSGYRSKAHNKKVGGVSDSAHLGGFAADIACSGSLQRFRIMNALIEAGFDRIGVASSFIHVDNDPDKPNKMIWTY